jgi:hypothetical protein
MNNAGRLRTLPCHVRNGEVAVINGLPVIAHDLHYIS